MIISVKISRGQDEPAQKEAAMNFEEMNLECLRAALSFVLNSTELVAKADRNTLVGLMVENDAMETVIELLTTKKRIVGPIKGTGYQVEFSLPKIFPVGDKHMVVFA